MNFHTDQPDGPQEIELYGHLNADLLGSTVLYWRPQGGRVARRPLTLNLTAASQLRLCSERDSDPMGGERHCSGDRITLLRSLGSGHFGQVWSAFAEGLEPGHPNCALKVAVKVGHFAAGLVETPVVSPHCVPEEGVTLGFCLTHTLIICSSCFRSGSYARRRGG